MSLRSSALVLLSCIAAANAIECYMGFKLIAGQTVGGQTIKCDNSGAQCYNATVAEGGGGVIDVMKMGCSMWRCMAARDSCWSTTIKNIPIKFCCCGTHLCNIDRNSAALANQRVGGWNAEKPQEGEEGAVMRVLGSDNAERPANNLTAEEMRSLFEGMNVDEDDSSTTVSPSAPEPSLGAEVDLENMRRFARISVFLLLLEVSAGFHDIFSYFLNNKQYIESVEQPWFRVHHSRHTKIPAEEKDQSSFGKHNVPDFGPEDKPYWTELEKRTFHCTTRACVCEFFGGTNSSLAFDQLPSKNTCRLTDGHLLKPAIRKEIRMMTDEERMSIEKALNEMKRDGTYNRLSRVHKYSGVHSGPAFTIWHRELLKRFELTVRKYTPSPHALGIPYWDTSLDSHLPEPKDSIMFTPAFLGTTNDEGHVITGPYANWTTMEGLPYITRKIGDDPEGEFLTPARIDWTIAQDDVNKVLAATLPLSTCETHSMDDRHLEYSHDYVHFYISGDMGRSWSSSNDVIFIYHHSMIDHIFELWRQRAQNRTERETQYTESDETCFPPWHNGDSFMPFLAPVRNIDGLSNAYTDNMYEFEPRPTCEMTKRDCGSKYLHCDVTHNIEPTCMSKIRLGGNCTGFEGTRVCYEAECVQGKCQQIAPPAPSKVTPKIDQKKQEMQKLKLLPFTFSPKLTKDILNM